MNLSELHMYAKPFSKLCILEREKNANTQKIIVKPVVTICYVKSILFKGMQHNIRINSSNRDSFLKPQKPNILHMKSS